MIKAGVGKSTVSLSLPIKKHTHEVTSLGVRILRLEDYALVNMDVTSIPSEAIRYFQETLSSAMDIPAENIVITAAHSFSSPHFNNHENYEPFAKALLEAVPQEMKECEIGYECGMCACNVQRNIETEEGYWIGRDPKGSTDQRVRTLFIYLDHKPAACLINYAMQSSCVMEKDASAVSSDVPGVIAEHFASQGIVSFYLPGACADQMPVSDDEQMIGKAIYDAIALPESTPLTYVNLYQTSTELPKQVMKYATKELRPHREYAFEMTEETVEVPLLFLTLNDMTIFLTSPELNHSYGKKIEQYLPEKNMVVTMTNGARKYLPEEWDYEHISYMAMNTEIGRGADTKLLQEIEKETQR